MARFKPIEYSRNNLRLVIIAALGFSAVLAVVFMLLPAMEENRKRSRQANCSGNLTAIATALLHYHDKYGHFPPAYTVDANNARMHSWRVLILEFIDMELFRKIKLDEPWNSPSNRLLEAKMPKCFACQNTSEKSAQFITSYVVVVGDGTAFPGSKSTNIEMVRAGNRNPVLAVESCGHDVHWMEPRDLEFEQMVFMINSVSQPSVSSRDPFGPAACLSDGQVVRLQDWSADKLKSMLLLSLPIK